MCPMISKCIHYNGHPFSSYTIWHLASFELLLLPFIPFWKFLISRILQLHSLLIFLALYSSYSLGLFIPPLLPVYTNLSQGFVFFLVDLIYSSCFWNLRTSKLTLEVHKYIQGTVIILWLAGFFITWVSNCLLGIALRYLCLSQTEVINWINVFLIQTKQIKMKTKYEICFFFFFS